MNYLSDALRAAVGATVTLFFIGGQELQGDLVGMSAQTLNQEHILTLNNPGRDRTGTAYISSDHIAGLVIHGKEEKS